MTLADCGTSFVYAPRARALVSRSASTFIKLPSLCSCCASARNSKVHAILFSLKQHSRPMLHMGGWKEVLSDGSYFFHFASPEQFIPDHDGVVFPNLKAAHAHALRLIGKTQPLMRHDVSGRWTIEIADERKFLVLTVLFPATAAAQVGPVPYAVEALASPTSSMRAESFVPRSS